MARSGEEGRQHRRIRGRRERELLKLGMGAQVGTEDRQLVHLLRRDVGAGPGPARPGEDPLGPPDHLPHLIGELTPIEEATGGEPERVKPHCPGMPGEDQQRPRVRRPQPPVETGEDGHAPRPAPDERGGTLVLSGRRRLGDAGVDQLQQTPTGILDAEERCEGLIEPTPIEVRVEVSETR